MVPPHDMNDEMSTVWLVTKVPETPALLPYADVGPNRITESAGRSVTHSTVVLETARLETTGGVKSRVIV